MSQQHASSAIVIGAGIVGLACARALSLSGFRVTVFERHPKAVGASIRNFGMVWPVGQPAGKPYERALRSRQVWKELGQQAGIQLHDEGSLHLAYDDAALQVMEELAAAYGAERNCRLLSPAETVALSPAVQPEGLKGALRSPDELIIDPREAIAQVAAWLQEQRQVHFHWNTAVTRIEGQTVHFGDGRTRSADLILVCSGADFETLYPEIYRQSPITKCKLQMMRLVAQPGNWRIGPALCGSLSLLHYGAFRVAPSLPVLRQWAEEHMAEYLEWGIHVMVSQQYTGELTIGDSHEYGPDPDPFDRQSVNELIIDYLKTFARFPDWRIAQSWHGVYAKMTDGSDHFLHRPADGVIILNALGGAGMTLSFGLAEEIMERL